MGNFLGGAIFLRVSLKLSEKVRIAVIIALFGIGYFTSIVIWLPFSIQAGCCATVFMNIGYLFKHEEYNFKSIFHEVRMVITIFALIVWGSFIKDFQSFWLVHCDVGRGIIDIFGCICASYIVLLVSQYIEKHFSPFSKWLSFLGQYSIFMLCIHIIELDLFPWERLTQKLVFIGMPANLEIYILIVCKLSIIILGTVICARWNVTRKLFGVKE